MKSTFCLLSLLVSIALSAHAQTTDSTSDPGFTEASGHTAASQHQPASPVVRASRQLTMFQKKLNLNQNQVIQLRTILLRLNVALDSLHSNPSPDRKANNQARRAINKDADSKIYELLTTDQQVTYAQWKQEQQLRRKLRQSANKAPATDTTAQHH